MTEIDSVSGPAGPDPERTSSSDLAQIRLRPDGAVLQADPAAVRLGVGDEFRACFAPAERAVVEADLAEAARGRPVMRLGLRPATASGDELLGYVLLPPGLAEPEALLALLAPAAWPQRDLMAKVADRLEQGVQVREGRRIRFANSAYGRVFGLAPGGDDALAWIAAVSPDEQQRAHQVAAAEEQGESISAEFCIRRNGVPRWIRRRSFSVGGVVAEFVEDVTAERQAQRERRDRELELRETLLVEVQHRVKNNLQGLVGLLRGKMGAYPELEDVLAAAVGQIQSMAIAYGLRSGRARACIGKLLTEVANNVREQFPAFRPELDLAAAGYEVDSDELVHLALSLHELLVNAHKHGGQRVRVEARALGGGELDVRIINGPARLPPSLDLDEARGSSRGLQLVRSLLPPEGARLSLRQEQEDVVASLRLRPPLVAYQPQSRRAGDR